MSLGANKIVGRQRELALLDRELGRLETGRGAVLQLVGEPGIGKSRLVAEASDRAAAKDYLTLIGRGDELQRNLPFGIFVDAIDDHLESVEEQLKDWLAPAHLLQLGLVFPSLSQTVTDDALELPNDRHRAYRAVRLLLERLSLDQPLLLALDDIHWADAGSLELFSYLVRHQPRGPVLIIAAQRPHSARLTPPDTRPEDSFEYLELEPLTWEDASALFPGDVDRATRKALLEESGGNPFYLQQLARSVSSNGEQPAAADAAQMPDVPQAVVRSIGNEISALPESVLTVLQAASVVGEPFEPDLVAQTAAISTDATLAALDVLAEEDLVRLADANRRFCFRHPIVRRAVYESAKPGWRLGAHARAAAALELRGAPPEERAHHVEHSARIGDELAIALLTNAAQSSAWRAPATAAGWFAAAASLLPDNESSRPRRLALMLQRATALAAAGQLEHARDTLADLLSDLPPDLTALRAQAVYTIALVEQVLTNFDQAEKLLLRTLHDLPEDNLTERTTLRNVLAVGKMFQGNFEEAREWAMLALDSARALDQPLAATAASMVAVAEINLGHVSVAREYAEEAAALFDAMPDSDLVMRLHGLPWLAWTEFWMDELDQAALHFERGVAIARAAGQMAVLVPMMVGQTTTLARQGKLIDALAIASEAVDLAHVCGSDQYLGWAHTTHCLVTTQLGDLTGAVASGKRAVEASHDLAGSLVAGLAGCMFAEAELEAGLPQESRDRLIKAAGGAAFDGVQRGITARWYDVLTSAELALGNVDAADEWACRAEADTLGLSGRIAYAKRARASVLFAQGDSGAAAAMALSSAAAAEAAGAPVEAARARMLAGKALAAKGQRKEAVAELMRAQRVFSDCNATRYNDQAAQELRNLGKRVSRGSRRVLSDSGVGALTDRELELSRLVATGKTNREIATDLFISEKTVQNHLSSIFAKLEVSSRAGVAGLIERTGG